MRKRQDRHGVVQHDVGEPLQPLGLPDVAQQEVVGDADDEDRSGGTAQDQGLVEPAAQAARAGHQGQGGRQRDEQVGQHGEVAQEHDDSLGDGLAIGQRQLDRQPELQEHAGPRNQRQDSQRAFAEGLFIHGNESSESRPDGGCGMAALSKRCRY